MNQYILDAIDQKAIDTELETSFTMMEYYMKRMRMESYLDTSMEEVYQEADRSLKEMWDSDTSAIHGREGEGAFMRVIKFLPRLIRNIIKWIVSHVRALFKKEKKADEARDKTTQLDIPDEAEKQFEEDLNEVEATDPKQTETSTESTKPSPEPASKPEPDDPKKELYKNADKTLNEIKAQQDEVDKVRREKNKQLLDNKKNEILKKFKWYIGRRTGTNDGSITAIKLFNEVFKQGHTVSHINIDMARRITIGISDCLRKLDAVCSDADDKNRTKFKVISKSIPEITKNLKQYKDLTSTGNADTRKYFYDHLYFYERDRYKSTRDEIMNDLQKIEKYLDNFSRASLLSQKNFMNDKTLGADSAEKLHASGKFIDEKILKYEDQERNKMREKGLKTGEQRRAMENLRQESKKKTNSLYNYEEIFMQLNAALTDTWVSIKNLNSMIITNENDAIDIYNYAKTLNAISKVKQNGGY